MSSVGQAVGGIVGAVVGFYVGGPSGAVYGAQIGMMAGGLIDPPKVQGPRLEDLVAQTSTYGAYIPRVYGTVAVHGNVFWVQGDKLIEHAVEDSGKGGPEVTNFEYFASFAVSLCEGPISGIRRIWIGGQLWYDAGSDDLSTILAGNSNARKFTLYTGTDIQEADPLIQADRGATNVPAYRGLAYIVFNELPLKGFGNSLAGAQVKVEVVTSGSVSPTLIDVVAIPNDPSWHTTYGAAGNQDDAQGMSNYVAALVDPPWTPQWIRTIGASTIVSPLPGVGSVHPVANSLNTLQYCYGRLDSRYAVWGESGNLAHEYDCGVNWKVDAFAEGGGFAYLIKQPTSGTDYTLVRLPFSDWVTDILSTGAPIYSLLSTWNGDAVVFYRISDTGAPLMLKIYSVIDGVLTSVITHTVDLSEPAYVIDSRNSAGHIVGDTLTIIGKINSVSATLIQINLGSLSVIKKLSLTTNLTGFTTPTYASLQVTGNMVAWGQRKATGSENTAFHQNKWAIDTITPTPVPLSAIAQSECLKSELLTVSDLDVTDLTDQVRGYRVSSLAPIRGGIDPLRKAWPFDVVQHGYKIKFVKRGGASVATITEAELDAREAGSDPGVQVTNVREMDTVIPDQLTIKYLDSSREYDINVAEQTR